MEKTSNTRYLVLASPGPMFLDQLAQGPVFVVVSLNTNQGYRSWLPSLFQKN